MTSSTLSLAGTDKDVRDAALHYWSSFGWPVRTSYTEVLLTLQRDMLAVVMDIDRGGPLLRELEAAGSRGCVLSLRGNGEPWWAFLITAPEPRRVATPPGVWVLSEGTDLPLPQGSIPANGVGWIREPISGGTLFDGDLLLDTAAA